MARSPARQLAAVLLASGALVLPVLPAGAEVRFGPGVRIGGHDFPNRRAGRVHIERVKRLHGPLCCRHVRHGLYRRGDGSVVRGPMEECNLIAKPPDQGRLRRSKTVFDHSATQDAIRSCGVKIGRSHPIPSS